MSDEKDESPPLPSKYLSFYLCEVQGPRFSNGRLTSNSYGDRFIPAEYAKKGTVIDMQYQPYGMGKNVEEQSGLIVTKVLSGPHFYVRKHQCGHTAPKRWWKKLFSRKAQK